MVWGSFGTVHLVTLALAVLINVAIYFLLMRTTRAKRLVILFILSLFGAGMVVVNVMNNSSDILRNLPLSFWALNALLLPIAVFLHSKRICNLLLIWSVASILALVLNSDMKNVEVFSVEFLVYYTMHVLGAGIPILIFETGIVKRDPRTVKSSLTLTIITFVAVHLTNIFINISNDWSVSEGVNYMSSLAPTSTILNFFYALIPSAFWYMIFVLPLILLYMLYWYLPEILEERKMKSSLREKLEDIDEYYEEYEEEYIDDMIDKKYGR